MANETVPQVTPKAPEQTPTPVVTPPVEVQPTVYESAATAVEAWQKSQTPELKTAMDEAIKKAKEFKPEAPKPVVPEKYELKPPEGSKLDVKHLETVSAFAKECGLSNEQAQALLERDHANNKAQEEKLLADYKQFTDGLVPLAKADKEIGGVNGVDFDKNVQLANRAVARYGDEDLKKLLNETGYGNHPAILRFALRVAKASKEDDLVIPGAPPAPKKTMEEKFYGPQK